MSRSLLLRLAVGLLATLWLTSVAVLSGPWHDEEAHRKAARPSDGPDPREPADRVADRPRGTGSHPRAEGHQPERLGRRGPGFRRGGAIGIEVVRRANAKVEGHRFTVRTQRKTAKKKKKQQAGVVGPVVRISLEAPPTARVTLTTGSDATTFRLDELTLGQPKPFRGGALTVERQDAAVRLTGSEPRTTSPPRPGR